MSIKGIDVSVHQGNINWQMVKEAGTAFAMIRAGYGKNADQKDKCFDANVKGAQTAGLHVGAYHYSYAKSVADAKAEAETFLKWIAPYKLDYPVAFDIEDKSQVALGKATLTAICKAFCEAVEAAGYYVCIYANPAWLKTYLDAPALAQYDLWLAHWTDNPTKAYSYGMWQYTSDGDVAGINGRVDSIWPIRIILPSSRRTASTATERARRSLPPLRSRSPLSRWGRARCAFGRARRPTTETHWPPMFTTPFTTCWKSAVTVW